MWIINNRYEVRIINVMETPINELLRLNTRKCVFELPELYGYVFRIYKEKTE
jgi:hypothetical protein